MSHVIASPSRYYQGAGALRELAGQAKQFGEKLFVITSASGRGRVAPKLEEGAREAGCAVVYEDFGGECCQSEIDRISAAFAASGCGCVIGVGGGKIHDTAKAVAHAQGAPVVIVPTIASTDAPCSALSVLYTEQGVFDHYLFLPASPNLVLVDTEIVAAAPARLLVAGMGDALATYFEARACERSGATNCVGGTITRAAMGLAKLCFDTLMADGVKAALAVERGVCTRAVENIVEANTYLSGIGFESGGLAGAHAIHNGLTALEQTHGLYHGEKVAFGTLVQLALENAPTEELEQVLDFCMAVGLPTTLEALGAGDATPDEIMRVAELACAPGDTMHNMPFPVTAQDVAAAITAADALGRAYLPD